MSSDLEEQQDELLALLSIFDPEEFVRNESKSSGEFRVSVELPKDFTVALKEGDTLSQYEISSLPPLLLTFDLPEDYPSCSPPSFSLKCSWLTPQQLSSLAAQLSDLYQTTGGTVVLFSWVQFLKDETLSFLGINNVLEIPSNGPTTNEDGSTGNLNHQDKSNDASQKPSVTQGQSDGGATNVARSNHQIPLALSPGQALMSQLLIHDAAQKEKAFSTQMFDCGVCFMSLLGSECVQLIECGHIFCRTCLAEFCKIQIRDGNVRDVTCLQADCKSTPTPAQVRSLVGEELFSRYDRLLLQFTLNSMPDVMYCPRPSCASAVITEEASSMALCTVCSFAFCVFCKKTYHGTEDCKTGVRKSTGSNGQQPLADTPQTQDFCPVRCADSMKALWDDYASASRERRKKLESTYGRLNLLGFMEETLSEDWITFNSKNCPFCFIRIQKTSGCNHMSCFQCSRSFCWNCLAKMPTGDHFRYDCHLYQYP